MDLSSHEWNGFSCVRKNRTQWAGTCMSFSLNASDDPWTCCVNGSGTSLYGFRRNRKGIKALTFKIRGSLNLQSGMGVSANIKLRSRPVISIISDLFTKQLEGVKRFR